MMYLQVIPQREVWGWRPTSRGIALIGCRLTINQFGMREWIPPVAIDWDNPISWKREGPVRADELMTFVDGSTRLRLQSNGHAFVQESGPFIVETYMGGRVYSTNSDGGYRSNQPRHRLRCVCGWASKSYPLNALRYLVAAQSEHVCQVIHVD